MWNLMLHQPLWEFVTEHFPISLEMSPALIHAYNAKYDLQIKMDNSGPKVHLEVYCHSKHENYIDCYIDGQGPEVLKFLENSDPNIFKGKACRYTHRGEYG